MSTKTRFRPGPSLLLSVRAAFCLTLPLAAGVVIGERRDSTLFALGALWAVSQDGLDSWHVRSPRLLSVVVGAGVGFALGVIFVSLTSAPALLVPVYAGIALAAGLIEASGFPAGGMYVLLGAIVGGGLRLGGSGWLSCVLVSAGACGSGSLLLRPTIVRDASASASAWQKDSRALPRACAPSAGRTSHRRAARPLACSIWRRMSWAHDRLAQTIPRTLPCSSA